MGLTSALYTGLTGLNANSQMISVSGNNIANVNTTGFKSSRMDFETEISQTLGTGAAPSSTSGGTNPSQVGLGVQIGGTSRNFSNGSLQSTGVSSNLAIDGNGFFVVKNNGATRYTRDGSFQLDQNFNLVNTDGGIVQGYGVDSQFNVVQTAPANIQIPIGAMTVAQATTTVNFSGNLNAGGTVATVGAAITSNELHTAASSASGVNDVTDPTTTNLTGMYATNSATALFATDDVITITGATKGGATLPDKSFQVGGANTTGSDANGTTLQSFLTFLTDVLGIDTTTGVGTGITVSAGQIAISGNTGAINDLGLASTNIIKNKASVTATQPFTMTQSQNANGESVRTTLVAYDSLGNAITIDASAVLESKNASGTTWRFYEQSGSTSALNRALGNGTLTFDSSGHLLNATNTSFNIDRSGTGAQTPQLINVSFTNNQGSISSLSDTTSTLTTLSQDGLPIGTLQSFAVDQDGTIKGTFSNSLVRNLGRVVVATFTNPQGLVDEGKNLFRENVNSGSASISTAGTAGAGKIVGGAIEQSNVDLSQEFINLISASTGFTASSRVLTTGNQLIQDLLATLR